MNPTQSPTPLPPPSNDWPARLDEAAFHGLAGDVVRTLRPHTEADDAAILVQFLVAFGAAVGRSHYFAVESAHHYANEFAVIIGTTSKARH